MAPCSPQAHVVAFVHQKGGTGKSTLAIGSALALAQAGQSVLLLDTDYQGTSGEWGNRFGLQHGVEVRSQVQPIVHEQVGRFAAAFQWIVVDGPPGLSPMTESLLRAGGRVIIPLRPAAPDVWALPWLAAMIQKLRNMGSTLEVRAVFNQYAGEDLAPFAEEVTRWNVPLHEVPVPRHPGFTGLFAGEPLPADLQALLLDLVGFQKG